MPYYGTDNDDYVNGEGFCCDDTRRLKSFDPAKNDNPELFQYYYHSDHLGSSSLITNLDGEVVQHVEYVPFGEVFIEERNNTWNTPYLFNAKELDPETSLYYYGARYYDPRTSVWLSVDALATYNPFEKENFIDGQHNGGVYNSFNLNVYSYCYQNPVKLVDPNGKQSQPMQNLGQAITGMSPEQLNSYKVNNEAEKVAIHAAKPAAISIPLTMPVFGIFGGSINISPTWILKGPKPGFHLFVTPALGLSTPGSGFGSGFEMFWLRGDERNFFPSSMTQYADEYSIGYKAVSITHTRSSTKEGDPILGFGLMIGKYWGPKSKWLNGSLGVSRSYTFDLLPVNESDYIKDETISTNEYYWNTYTNFNLQGLEFNKMKEQNNNENK